MAGSNFFFEETSPGLYGHTVGTNQKVDFSGSPEVLLPAGQAGSTATTIVVAASNSLHTVADYICTGTNDQTTINTAIGALPAGGGRILLLEGTYNLGGAVVINKSNVSLEGQGMATILKLANSTNTDCVQIGDGTNTYTNIYIKNLLVDGNMANQTTGANGINLRSTTNYCAIRECTIQNTIFNNINFEGTSYYTIIENNYLLNTKAGQGYANISSNSTEGFGIFKNNYCSGADGNGIFMNGGGGEGDTIEGNVILNLTGGYAITTSIRSRTEGNLIKLSGVSTANGIYDNQGQNDIFCNIIYCTNNPTTNYSNGLIFSASSYTNIIGNILYVDTGNTAPVYAINPNSTDVVCADNFVYFNTSFAHLGIINESTNQVIINNNVKMNGSAANSVGIQCYGDESNISGNRINGFAIALTTQAFSQTINNNKISNSLSGVLITNAQNCSISNNVFDTVSGYGIEALNTVQKTGFSICGNTFSFMGGDGIYLQGITQSSISNNVLRLGTTTNAIFVTSTGTAYSVYNTIIGNNISSSGVITNGIKENSVNDGPNIINGNIIKNCTNPIVTANVSTDISHNITA